MVPPGGGGREGQWVDKEELGFAQFTAVSTEPRFGSMKSSCSGKDPGHISFPGVHGVTPPPRVSQVLIRGDTHPGTQRTPANASHSLTIEAQYLYLSSDFCTYPTGISLSRT